MLKLKNNIIYIELPQGKTQAELVKTARAEVKCLAQSKQLYGKHIKLNGRCTTGMALMLGHELAHLCKSVSIFDPKENSYLTCIEH